MKLIIIGFIFSFACVGMAQSPLGGTPLNAPKKAAEAQPKQKPGIRFVLRNREGSLPESVSMQIDERKFAPVDFRLGLPGERVSLPKINRIRIFEKEPTPEMIKKGVKPIVDAPIPAGMGPKMIGLVGYGKNGYDIRFIDETGMRPGLVYFINLTNKDYLIDVPKAPGSETKRFDLKGGAQYTFGTAISGEYMDSIPYRIYQQAMVKGQPQWIVERRSMMSLGKTRSSILILMPDAGNTSMILHEIMVYK